MSLFTFIMRDLEHSCKKLFLNCQWHLKTISLGLDNSIFFTFLSKFNNNNAYRFPFYVVVIFLIPFNSFRPL